MRLDRRASAVDLPWRGLLRSERRRPKGLLPERRRSQGGLPRLGGLLLYWLSRRRPRERAEAPLGRADIPWLAGAITCGGVVAPLLLMMGLTRTPASAASLLLNLEGVFSAGLAWVLFREHVHPRIVLGMLAIVAGGALLSWQGQFGLAGLAGPLAVAGACFAWGLDNNLTQQISARDPVQITMLKGLVAGAANTALALLLGASWPPAAVTLSALMVGFLGYGVSLVLYVRALRELGTARTGAYFSLAPFIGAALAVVLWLSRSLCRSWALHCWRRRVLLHLTEVTGTPIPRITGAAPPRHCTPPPAPRRDPLSRTPIRIGTTHNSTRTTRTFTTGIATREIVRTPLPTPVVRRKREVPLARRVLQVAGGDNPGGGGAPPGPPPPFAGAICIY
jgi:drug/metabolite transporter (DMT)-like permease